MIHGRDVCFPQVSVFIMPKRSCLGNCWLQLSVAVTKTYFFSHFFSKHISVRTITLCSFERAGLCDDDAVASGFSKSFAKVWHGVAIRPRRQPRRQPCKHKRVVAPWHDVEVRLYPGWCGRHCCEQQGPELQLHTAFWSRTAFKIFVWYSLILWCCRLSSALPCFRVWSGEGPLYLMCFWMPSVCSKSKWVL